MEVASMEVIRQFSSRAIVITGHRQNKILCEFCNRTQFPKDFPGKMGCQPSERHRKQAFWLTVTVP